MKTPDNAKRAVQRVLSEVPREHEAAYRVIYDAVRICIEAGMKRRTTANFLGISRWRIDRQGRYFRSIRATRDLFRFDLRASTRGSSVEEIVERAWKR